MCAASQQQEQPRIKESAACPGCTREGGLTFWRAERVPVLCHAQCLTREQALAAPHASIDLTLCQNCGLVYNSTFDMERIGYNARYENALHFSPCFREYAERVAHHLVEEHQIRGGRVLEIGCGDGQFLASICQLGGNQGLGLDPAHDPDRSVVTADLDVRIITAPFDAQTAAAFPADLICCRHVLEHLKAPMTLLRTIRAALGDRRDTLLYFEVPNLLHTIERMGIWDLIYEHCLYFTPASLHRLFRTAGFDAIDYGETYGGQFAWIEAVPTERCEVEPDGALARQLETLATRFEVWCAARMSEMRERLETMADAGQQVVVWGAGSKTVTMLNVLQINDHMVSAVVDQNPRKHGHYIVGTGQSIISPEAVRQIHPDVVIVMNPLYRDEIVQQLGAMDIYPEIVMG